METTLVIPAINEEESLPHVLAAIDMDLILEVLLVDGGSHDRTVEIAADHGVCVIHEHQPGYGRACAAGLSQAQGEIVVFMDADGADDPDDDLQHIFKDFFRASNVSAWIHSGSANRSAA